MSWSPLLRVGAALFFAGGIVALVVLGRVGGMAFGMKAFHNLGRFLSDPGQRGTQIVFFVALGVAFLGVAFCFAGVVAGDRARNAPCVKACKDAGYDTGVFRVSPHLSTAQGGSLRKQCWCRKGQNEWSPEPIDVEPGR